MDPLIAKFDYVKDQDLMLCPVRGVAYQRNMAFKVNYDEAYFNKCLGYADQDIALKINAGRIALVNKYAGESRVLDVGVGSGEFIKKRGPGTFGYDVNPTAIAWLKEQKLFAEELWLFKAFTFWDVLEHVENPQAYFKHMANDSYLFASIPVFLDLAKIRRSKHYRPGEHLYYWTKKGFVDWMALHRWRCLEVQTYEVEAGRESILSFAFKRDLPGYHQTVSQYKELHSKIYGASSHIYLDLLAPHIIDLNPPSILDYGCGNSDLVAYFWRDGLRRVARYDPAIPEYANMPEGHFNLVLCTDVMEHILMEDVERVLWEIKAKSSNVIFVISLKLARKVLPDGRNAHVTLMTETEWMRWVRAIFGRAIKMPSRWDHALILKTF